MQKRIILDRLKNITNLKPTIQTTIGVFLAGLLFLSFPGFGQPSNSALNKKTDKTLTDKMHSNSVGSYAVVNGLKMYYEIHRPTSPSLVASGGKSKPLVLIHGGGSTILTTFGNVLTSFAKHREVIAVELQAHGHTADRDRASSFEQDADDVAALLKQLQIRQADFFGFSNGGNTAMQIAIRHPEIVHKLVIGSSFYKRDGFYPEFWQFMKQASLENMPAQLKEAYLSITSDPKGFAAMHDRDKQRMLDFKDWPDESIRSIQAPTLLISGDQDVVRPEHTVEMYRLLPHGHLATFPGKHGEYIGEITVANKHSQLPSLVVLMIEEFLDEKIY